MTNNNELTGNLEAGYRSITVSKDTPPNVRLLVGVPMTGLVRAEWALARWGQIIPCNWSHVDYVQFIDQYSPLRFVVADARNLCAQECVRREFEWMLFIDHDVVLPSNFLVAINEYMHRGVPLVSGLYFTKSRPSEPLIYRGRGNSYYDKWKFGEVIEVDGLPMGCTLISGKLLRVIYEASEEYKLGHSGQTARRVFETPARTFFDPETMQWNAQTGTEDLAFCSRVINDGFLKKAGFEKEARKKFPFLIDTNLFCWHIDNQGVKYPSIGEQMEFMPKKK